MFTPEKIDFTKTKTFSARGRHNLVTAENLRTPDLSKDNLYESEEMSILIKNIKSALPVAGPSAEKTNINKPERNN